MDYGFGGAVTVSETLGPALVLVPVLLETTPFASTPIIVNEYVFAGVIPFGVVVEVVLVPHPGTRTRVPVSTRIVRNPQVFLARGLLPLPIAMIPSRGNANHRAYKAREC
jgi:hypothetical protein